MRNLLRISSLLIAISVQTPAQDTRWHFEKDNPKTKNHIIQIDAPKFQLTSDPHTIRLHNMSARLYDSSGSSYKQIASEEATVDQKLRTLTYGPRMQTVVKF